MPGPGSPVFLLTTRAWICGIFCFHFSSSCRRLVPITAKRIVQVPCIWHVQLFGQTSISERLTSLCLADQQWKRRASALLVKFFTLHVKCFFRRFPPCHCPSINQLFGLPPSKNLPGSEPIVSSWKTPAGWGHNPAPVHVEAEPCGSRSTSAVTSPSCSLATAGPHASVAFPVPPFRLMSATVKMASQSSHLYGRLVV